MSTSFVESGLELLQHSRLQPGNIHQARDAFSLLVEQKLRLYEQNCWLWMMEQVHTVDETRKQVLPFPEKDYCEDLIGILTDPTERMIAIPKSRRMLVTWTVCAWACWEARFHANTLGFFQSENEEKAAFAIDRRMMFIEDHLADEWCKLARTPWKTKEGTVGKFQYQHNQSVLWGVPQGADIIRGYTFSHLIMDESEFQREGRNAMTSALSIVENGAKLVILSSSNGPSGILADICSEVGIRHLKDWVVRV